MLHRMILLAQQHTFQEGEFVYHHSGGGEAAAAAGVMFFLFFIFWMVIVLALTVAITVIPLWIICKKAGLSPYMSLLILVPGVNMAFYWILALINWPNLKPEAGRDAYNFFDKKPDPVVTPSDAEANVDGEY